MPRWARNRFRGLETGEARHLIENGRVAAMRNLMARGGVLRTRRGFRRATDVSTELGPNGVDLWPSLIFSFDPNGTGNDSTSPVDTPEEPYGTVETTPDPTVEDGALIDGLDDEEEESSYIDKKDEPEPLPIQAGLPGVVYDRCRFAMQFVCTGFDGSGADLTSLVFDAQGFSEAVDLHESPAVGSGWIEGVWEGTGRVDASTDDVMLYVRCTTSDRGGVSATATVALPVFVVDLPDEAVAGTDLTVTVTCLGGGMIQTGYEGAGAGLSLMFERYDESAEEWVSLDTVGLASLGSGWTDGVWSDEFGLGDLNGSPLIRAVLTYPGREGDETDTDECVVELGETLAVDLPDAVEAYAQFTFALSALDGAGNYIDGIDTTRISLVWHYAATKEGPWTGFTPLDVEPLEGAMGSGTAELYATLAPEALQVDGYLRLTAYLDGEPVASDIAYLDVDYEGHIAEIILERQKAASINPTYWIDPEGTYTLSQLIGAANSFTADMPAGTNWIAPGSNDWIGGFDPPDALGEGNYFGAVGSGMTYEVDTVEALFKAVIKFRKLSAGLGTVGGTKDEYEGVKLSTGGITQEEAKAAAEADWAYTPQGESGPRAYAWVSTPSEGYWSAKIQLTRFRVAAGLRVGGQIGKRVRQFYKVSALGTFHPEGFSVAEGFYAAYTDETFAAGEATDGEFPGSADPLPHWPTVTGDAPAMAYCGFETETGFALVDPEFSY